jgi:xylan 1,4-beta-xylosidase
MRLPFVLVLMLFLALESRSQKLVLPGDYPDPSVVKIGDTYWASATTSNWLPAYPLLKSKDLITWTLSGNVFTKPPDWVDYYFWAPEITYENGKVYIYYSAHKKNGNLCVGVASADKPEGPYTDHGALICQEVGSIDAFPMRDENGKLYMIWKEDGNSVRKPTPIWAQQMNEERTALIGEKVELFRNDQPWEGNLVEGVSMIKHNGYYYAFYAAAGCCGTGCTYTTGVARSKTLLGPWEKYNKNPILSSDEQWKCPGHGTPVEKDGRYYFMYHAYDTESSVYTGRQGLLIEFRFTPDGWIEFIKDDNQQQPALKSFTEKFKKKKLPDDWQWSVFHQPVYEVGGKKLRLNALPASSGSFLAQKNTGADYTAEVCVDRKTGAAAGLSLIGDERNMVTLFRKGDSLNLMQLRNNKDSLLSNIMVSAKDVYLRMVIRNGKDITYFYSTNGKTFLPVNATPVNGAYLPPWDRALRVGLVSRGNENEQAVFKMFKYIAE